MLPKSFLGFNPQHLHPQVSFVIRGVAQDSCQLGESRKAMGALAKVSQDSRPDWLSDELIQAELAGFDSKHQGFNAAFWAEKSGDTEIYNTMYRRLNSFSHGSLGALNAYLPVDGNNQFTSVISDVGKGYASQFLVNASSILLEELQMIDGAHGRNGQCGEFARFGVLLHQIQEQIVSTSDIRPPA